MEFKNDLGKPWKYQEGDFEVIRTSVWSPPGCHPVGCSLKLYVDKDGRLDHVEGDENDPITHGRLCPRCLALKDYIYNPSRVVYPMKRAREDRGLDKWERTTWDEAIQTIMDNWKRITAEYGKESMVMFLGTGYDGMLTSSFMQTIFRSPNNCYTQSGYACYQPRSFSAQFVMGTFYPEIDYAGGLEGGYDNPEYRVPEVIVLWGKEPLRSNPDGFFGHSVIDLMKRGAKLIMVDPRVDWLACRSVYHLRLRPGTDAAIAMAWANVIIEEDLYDHEFVENWCYGFDEFAQRVAEMPPSRAAEITGVDEGIIIASARMYANAKPASIGWGLAFDQNPNGSQAAHVVIGLMALTGNIDVPGGQIVGELEVAGDTDNEEVLKTDAEAQVEGTSDEEVREGAGIGGLSRGTRTRKVGWYAIDEETRNKCIGMDKYPIFCQATGPHADTMLKCLETDDPYPIRMGWVQSTNLLGSSNSEEPERWHDAMVKAFDFCFGTDCFITPTIQATCDLFLPLATVAEKNSVNQVHYGSATIAAGATNKAINVGETKSDQEIEMLLLKAMGGEIAETFTDDIDWFEFMRLRGFMAFDELSHAVRVQRKPTYRKYELGKLRPDGKPGFNTPTGRVELWSSNYARGGEDPLPYYQEPPFSATARPDLAEEYPLVLTTGARTFAFFHSQHRQIPYLRELNPNPIVEVNPEDACAAHVTEGQWVSVENSFGSAKFKAHITPTVRKGVVMAQHGWWFPEQDCEEPNLYGTFQSNINKLIPNDYHNEIGYCNPAKCMNCRIVPLNENYDTDMQLIWDKFGKLV